MAQWLIAAKRADFQGIAEKYGIDPVIARLIRNRDIIEEVSYAFFSNFVLNTYHSAPVMHTEEYVPHTIPTIRGSANSRILVTPKI